MSYVPNQKKYLPNINCRISMIINAVRNKKPIKIPILFEFK